MASNTDEWQSWVASYTDIEKRAYGHPLDGEERHAALYNLFSAGYIPQRAFDLIKAAEEVERTGPFVYLFSGTFSIIGIAVLIAYFVKQTAGPTDLIFGVGSIIFGIAIYVDARLKLRKMLNFAAKAKERPKYIKLVKR
jgi:hypothetical protein